MDRKILLEKISCTAKALRGSGELNIRVKSGEMEVSAASDHLAVSNRFPVDCMDMYIAVKASTMLAIIGKIPEDEISLALNGETVLVKWKTGKASLPVFEYKEVMRKCGKGTIHPIHHLTQYVGQVVHSLDNTGYNPLMSTVHIQLLDEGGFQLTALDGKRYSIRQVGKGKPSGEYVVYGQELYDALKLMRDAEINILEPEDGNFIQFSSDGMTIQVSLFGKPYFNLDALRSMKHPVRVMVNKQELSEAVALVKQVSEKVFVDFAVDHVTIAGTASSGESIMKIPAVSRGLDEDRVIRTAFHVTLLSEALDSMDSEQIIIHMKDALSQFCLTDGHYAIEMVLAKRRESAEIENHTVRKAAG